MFQEKRYLATGNGDVLLELEQSQKAIIDGNAAAIFDWQDAKLTFYTNEGGQQCKVKLPKHEIWIRAEADYGVLRIAGNKGGYLAYLMSGGKFLGYYRGIVDVPVAHGLEVRAIDEEERWHLLRKIHW